MIRKGSMSMMTTRCNKIKSLRHDIYAGEDSDEQHVTEEDEDTRTPLTSVVRDPHLKELLLKKTTNRRSAAREQSKLAN